MDIDSALAALAALSQRTRLETYRSLVKHEPDGMAAGEVARLIDVPQNTMSSHLATLARACVDAPRIARGFSDFLLGAALHRSCVTPLDVALMTPRAGMQSEERGPHRFSEFDHSGPGTGLPRSGLEVLAA